MSKQPPHDQTQSVFQDQAFQHDLDACGLFCPEPVMMLHNKVRAMSEGDVLRVMATDPSTERDIPKFCKFLNHELLASGEVEGDKYCYFIKKSGSLLS